ncbi:hypothetical protein [Stenotrophomonas pigmentata]|uniref:hypothetical protein n=1 Tax=Stenotrophomonas pigmentata TaxID=3055080 RepID=UPI0026EA6755|nr:hypothetical protein [Stenotrophomonas sp. 610A2]
MNIKTILKTVTFLAATAAGTAIAADMCDFCTIRYQTCINAPPGSPLYMPPAQCLAVYEACKQEDCPAP